MVAGLLKRIFGSRNERLIRRYHNVVRAINAREAGVSALSDADIRARTDELRQKVANGMALDSVLVDAFALVREGAKRALEMRHFDVQLIGGLALHEGKIAEMRTGEGKTLVATLPAYLNALAGKGVHVVTVNDYLAQRDAAWMGRLYNFLGLSVGVNLPHIPHDAKQAAYKADITYGTNNEYGFDYLRDNMVADPRDRVQRGLFYGIVDEVDSILIDEARTPLIISGHAADHTDLYIRMNDLVPRLVKQLSDDGAGDYTVDEKQHQVLLTEQGHEKAEQLCREAGLLSEGGSLYEPANINLMHHIYAALRAHNLFKKEHQYVVQRNPADGRHEIVIVDEFTGRLMAGRRWSDGLHQAIEAKEGVPIQRESQTFASITFQNYFRLYGKLAGMTGTADTEAYEFYEIYGLETVVIPTHMKMVRDDRMDKVFRTGAEKYRAIIDDIRECQQRGQPVLVGTASIENSELLSGMLQKEGITHQVLNAKHHAREAEIIAQAGRPTMVTIATNMAGRGTDIVLGGSITKQLEAVRLDESRGETEKQLELQRLRSEWQVVHDQVVSAGGLHIVGTERHESRRIDNQLRGRSGRQGDPGSSRFYLALDDPLLRIFAGEKVAYFMQKLKMEEGEAIEHTMVTRSIEGAQRKVEQRNFDIRKQLLEYDDVANDQRKVIYQLRNEILDHESATDLVNEMRNDALGRCFRGFVPEQSVEEQWEIAGLERALANEFALDLPVAEWLKKEANLDDEQMLQRICDEAGSRYRAKAEGVGLPIFQQIERRVLLDSLDNHWREHLSTLDHLRQGIHLRAFAQKNPKQEYKREAFELFKDMLDAVRLEVTTLLILVEVRREQQVDELPRQQPTDMQFTHDEFASPAESTEQPSTLEAEPEKQRPYRAAVKVGRNEPCPCGSGKKYKQCHGRLA